MQTTRATTSDATTERLAGEIADVRASIHLVSGGVASRVTLTALRFGPQVSERLRGLAAREGVVLEEAFWPDEYGDLTVVRRPDGDRDGRPDQVAGSDQRTQPAHG
jgi:hypothetical protein